MAGVCSVIDCGRPKRWRTFCDTHYSRFLKTGIASGPIQRKANAGTGHKNSNGYVVLTIKGQKRLGHIVMAEKALGKPLPAGAEVHHVDEQKSNNVPGNLVICPDAAYHKLLHQRQRAFNASGHYHWRKCQFCKVYDDPANDMWTSDKKAYHRSCSAAYTATRKLNKERT